MNTPSPKILALLATVPLWASCGGGGGSSAPALAGEVEATPSTEAVLAVDSGELAGLRLTIPAGAVDAPVTISVTPGSTTETTDRTVAGAAATFGPAGLQFVVPAELDLPFDPALVSATSDLFVQLRDDTTNTIQELTPTSVNFANNTVRVAVPHFSTCWPTTRDEAGGPSQPMSGDDFEAFGSVSVTGPDTPAVGTQIAPNEFIPFESGSGLPVTLGFFETSLEIVGDQFVTPDGVDLQDLEDIADLENIVVMNISDLTGGLISMTIVVDGTEYDYACTGLDPVPCGNLTIDRVGQTVTFDDVVVMPIGDSAATGPLTFNGMFGWRTPR